MSRIVKPDHLDWQWRVTNEGVPDAVVAPGGKTMVQLGPVATDGLSAVTYNGSSQVTEFTVGTTPYVVTYPDASTIVVTGGGLVKTIGLDGSGRISTVTVT